MNLYFDLEYTGLHQNADIISVGIESEDNDKFYFETNQWSEYNCDDFVIHNVIPKLEFYKTKKSTKPYQDIIITNDLVDSRYIVQGYGSVSALKNRLVDFICGILERKNLKKYKFQFIGDTCFYDWVLFCDVFYGSANLPTYMIYYPIDISTILEMKGYNAATFDRENYVNKDKKRKHHALFDAEITKLVYEKLIKE